MIKSLILSLILTIGFEVFLSYILGVRKPCNLIIVIIVNICTNPIVVFISNLILYINNLITYYICVAILEVGAILIEWLLYQKYLKEKLHPLKLSICNNIFSFFMGLIICLV